MQRSVFLPDVMLSIYPENLSNSHNDPSRGGIDYQLRRHDRHRQDITYAGCSVFIDSEGGCESRHVVVGKYGAGCELYPGCDEKAWGIAAEVVLYLLSDPERLIHIEPTHVVNGVCRMGNLTLSVVKSNLLFLDEIAEELNLDMELHMNLNLVLEEMVSNVIFYAYPEGKSADIELVAESHGKELTFVLTDRGKEFDPTAKEDADPDINPMERDIGGMGIYIVKNIMNEVSYQRLEGKNLLTMTKEI